VGSTSNAIGGAAAIAALLVLGCRSSSDPSDPPVARAFEQVLYWSDLRQVVPMDLAPEDSAAFAKRYINDWVLEQVVLQRARKEMGPDDLDIEARIEAYRNSLVTYAYEEALVAQKLDTVVSGAEVQKYYTDNEKNFLLKDNIVRVRWFKVREDDRSTLRKVESLWRSGSDKDRHELEVWLARNGSTIFDSREDWLPFTELLQQVPLEVDNPTDWIPRNRMVMARDSVNTYFVELLEHRLGDAVSPLPMVEDRIRSILVNQRKQKLIERMRQDLYTNALEAHEVEVY
jgi:hypothetical protein